MSAHHPLKSAWSVVFRPDLMSWPIVIAPVDTIPPSIRAGIFGRIGPGAALADTDPDRRHPAAEQERFDGIPPRQAIGVPISDTRDDDRPPGRIHIDPRQSGIREEC